MDTAIQPGRRAWVHLHVPTGRYSIKYSGQPVFYVDAVQMRACDFHLSEPLRRKFEQNPNRRTVHAHVVGEIVAFAAPEIAGERVSCNPFKMRGFVRLSDGAAAVSADEAVLYPGGRIEARGIVVDPSRSTDPGDRVRDFFAQKLQKAS